MDVAQIEFDAFVKYGMAWWMIREQRLWIEGRIS